MQHAHSHFTGKLVVILALLSRRAVFFSLVLSPLAGVPDVALAQQAAPSSDNRIVLWDLYNEPGNSGMGNKSLPLVEAAFDCPY